MIMAGIKAFSLLSSAWRWSIIVVAVGALVTAYGVWHYKVYRSGYTRAISDIAAQDERAITQAETKRAIFKQCRAAGKRWDQVEGRCL